MDRMDDKPLYYAGQTVTLIDSVIIAHGKLTLEPRDIPVTAAAAGHRRAPRQTYPTSHSDTRRASTSKAIPTFITSRSSSA